MENWETLFKLNEERILQNYFEFLGIYWIKNKSE